MSAPMVVHLMRHGEPVLTGRLLGHADVPATPGGIEACRAAALDTGCSAIVSSDLSRAAACAAAAGASLMLPVRIDRRWRELDFGDWDGRVAGEVEGDALARFWNDPDSCPPPGGERWSALVARVTAGLRDLQDGALVITHAGAMRAALAALCGLDARQVWAVALPYAATLSLSLWQDGESVGGQMLALRP